MSPIAESEVHIFGSYHPDFAFCGTFNGKGSESGSRWLKKFEYEHEYYCPKEHISPDFYLNTLNLLLVEDAAIWADTTEEIVSLFEKKLPNQDDVKLFKVWFTLRYPPPSIIPLRFSNEIRELRQMPQEPLASYYNRTSYLLARVGGQNLSTAASSDRKCSLVENSLIQIVLKAFVEGIGDKQVILDTFPDLYLEDTSLHSLYKKAEQAYRARLEAQRILQKKERKEDQHFLRVATRRYSAQDDEDPATESTPPISEPCEVNCLSGQGKKLKSLEVSIKDHDSPNPIVFTPEEAPLSSPISTINNQTIENPLQSCGNEQKASTESLTQSDQKTPTNKIVSKATDPKSLASKKVSKSPLSDYLGHRSLAEQNNRGRHVSAPVFSSESFTSSSFEQKSNFPECSIVPNFSPAGHRWPLSWIDKEVVDGKLGGFASNGLVSPKPRAKTKKVEILSEISSDTASEKGSVWTTYRGSSQYATMSNAERKIMFGVVTPMCAAKDSMWDFKPTSQK